MLNESLKLKYLIHKDNQNHLDIIIWKWLNI